MFLFHYYGELRRKSWGKKSTRENKTIFQICREEKNLTRETASEKMAGVSASRIEKIEYEQQEPTPYDILQMAHCYGRPDLCNYYCSHKCNIGKSTFLKFQLPSCQALSWKPSQA